MIRIPFFNFSKRSSLKVKYREIAWDSYYFTLFEFYCDLKFVRYSSLNKATAEDYICNITKAENVQQVFSKLKIFKVDRVTDQAISFFVNIFLVRFSQFNSFQWPLLNLYFSTNYLKF